MSAKASTTRLVLRQRSQLGLSAVAAVTGLVLLFSLARSWTKSPQPLSAAWVVFALALVWLLFVRPAVLLDGEGVTLRNIVRDIHIPWTLVDDVDARWNLKVFVGDRGYTAWAISSHVERPKGGSIGMLEGLMPRGLDKHVSPPAHPPSSFPKVTASLVARSIDQAKDEYDDAVAHGALVAPPDGQVRVRWVPLALAILVLPAVPVLVLSLV
jgi:hypothetical protein